ncbi:ATP-binding protein [Bradyrhizobium sp. CCBAU 21362]|uniref:ATP-binding protein n=1 Tax=Bradyrhizobium sp. CCBAU 21362 TaxID=1325082 RepID=UPI002306ACBA|nr:ATP-binding protein [Bradyrhizobium sp. CCBAU 21362]
MSTIVPLVVSTVRSFRASPPANGSTSTTISSSSVSQWHDVIADPTLGDAILDRIIHKSHRIELKGDSLRRRADDRTAA